MKTIGNKEECCQAGGAGNKEDQRLTSVLTSIGGIIVPTFLDWWRGSP